MQYRSEYIDDICNILWFEINARIENCDEVNKKEVTSVKKHKMKRN